MGYALMQYTDEGIAKLIQCGSRSLSDAETRYAPIELECLGIAWAVEKCSHFLLGHPKFTVITDHEPLKGIFQKDLHEIINRRLQRFRERLMPYSFTINWKAGKLNLIADAFSRSPVSIPNILEQDEDHSVRYISSCDLSLKECIYSSADSATYKKIIQNVLERKIPSDLHPSNPCQQYASFWHSLSVSEDKKLIIYNGSKILIPQTARQRVLHFLHKGHCGFIKTKQLLQELYFWPNMVNELKQLIAKCDQCAKFAPSQRHEPLLQTNGTFPFEKVGVDLFQANGKHYLVLIDSLKS